MEDSNIILFTLTLQLVENVRSIRIKYQLFSFLDAGFLFLLLSVSFNLSLCDTAVFTGKWCTCESFEHAHFHSTWTNMADSPAISSSQSEQVLPEKKNNGSGDRKNHGRERSISVVGTAARAKLAQLIQLASEAQAEGETDYKKVVDTVFDSVGHYFLNLFPKYSLYFTRSALYAFYFQLQAKFFGSFNSSNLRWYWIIKFREGGNTFPDWLRARIMLITCHFLFPTKYYF